MDPDNGEEVVESQEGLKRVNSAGACPKFRVESQEGLKPMWVRRIEAQIQILVTRISRRVEAGRRGGHSRRNLIKS